jgi:DNA-directed RNA polymerase beta' subunit
MLVTVKGAHPGGVMTTWRGYDLSEVATAAAAAAEGVGVGAVPAAAAGGLKGVGVKRVWRHLMDGDVVLMNRQVSFLYPICLALCDS